METRRVDLEYLRKNDLIIFESVSGSRAYGLNTKTSDTDIRGVFIIPSDILLSFGYVDQVNDSTNDTVFYELKRFMELLEKNNPNILELLNVPEDCILKETAEFKAIKEHAKKFLTKKCMWSFVEYANTQISKARGLNKKIVNPIEVKRKNPIEFCYVLEDEKSVPLEHWMKGRGYEQLFCGIVNVPHMKDMYALFYDWEAHACFSPSIAEDVREESKRIRKENGHAMGLGYKGIYLDDESLDPDTIRLSSIPVGQKAVCNFHFNKDGFWKYLKDFREYREWEKKRNVNRYNENMASGKGYDGKNLMHCMRLLYMAEEIATKKEIIVRRTERDFLLSIRKGEMEYDDLIKEAEERKERLFKLFKESDLPDNVDREFLFYLLLKVRKMFYTTHD